MTPINPEDNFLYPLGFVIGVGKIIRFDTPNSADSLSPSEAWADKNCKVDENLKKHINYLKAIKKAKQACESGYNTVVMPTAVTPTIVGIKQETANAHHRP